MKKLTIVLLVSALGLQTAWADSFNYPTVDACNTAMGAYATTAEGLVNNINVKVFSPEWKGFENLNRFFGVVMTQGSAGGTSCSGGTCTQTLQANCSAVSAVQAWTKLMVPLLTKEVGYLNQATYDPSLTPSTAFLITCTYPDGSPNDFKNCTLSQQ